MRVTLQHAGAQAGRQAAGRALTQDWEDEAAGVDLQGGGGAWRGRSTRVGRRSAGGVRYSSSQPRTKVRSNG